LNSTVFVLNLSLLAIRHGHWFELSLSKCDRGFAGEWRGLRADLVLTPKNDRVDYSLRFNSPFLTRLPLAHQQSPDKRTTST
jgi:hypothetical protein